MKLLVFLTFMDIKRPMINQIRRQNKITDAINNIALHAYSPSRCLGVKIYDFKQAIRLFKNDYLMFLG